jgi:hypothetical protein
MIGNPTGLDKRNARNPPAAQEAPRRHRRINLILKDLPRILIGTRIIWGLILYARLSTQTKVLAYYIRLNFLLNNFSGLIFYRGVAEEFLEW